MMGWGFSRRGATLFLLTVGLALVVASAAAAQSRWIDATASTDLGPILRDDVRDLVYLGDSAAQEVVVIDALTEQVVRRIGVPGPVRDMALKKGGGTLGVIGGGFLTTIDLNKFRARSGALPSAVSGETMSLAFDAGDRIYVGTGLNGWGWIYVLSRRGNRVINDFGLGPNLTWSAYNPLLETDATGTILYVSDRGLSPLSIYKIDISDYKNPQYLADDAHGSLGSNLQDYALSNRYNEVYVASGSPYGIQVVDAADMGLLALLTTGAYPAGVAVGPLGERIFGLPSSPYNNFLYEFDAATRTETASYVLDSQVPNGKAWPRGVAVDRFGQKAFVVHGGNLSGAVLKVQVIDVGGP